MRTASAVVSSVIIVVGHLDKKYINDEKKQTKQEMLAVRGRFPTDCEWVKIRTLGGGGLDFSNS